MLFLCYRRKKGKRKKKEKYILCYFYVINLNK